MELLAGWCDASPPRTVARAGRRKRAMEYPGFAPGPRSPAVPLWQRVWLDAYPCDVPSSLPYPNIPVGALLDKAAQRFPDRRACTLYGRATTYRQLQEQARRFATALAKLGARRGRRLGMLLPNTPDYLV